MLIVSVEGFPERRAIENQHQLNQNHQIQEHKENTIKEAAKDCIANSASSIAQKAAAEAQAAQAAQNAAGAQAAHMAKTQLAEKALQAAKAAEAALAGKQVVVEHLQEEVKEVEALIAENIAAVQHQQSTVNSAMQVAQQVTAQHKLLIQATQLAAQLEKSIHGVLGMMKFGLQKKGHNLSEARARLASLKHKLQCAYAEYAATKQAAHIAFEAAKAACGNARRKKRKRNIQIQKGIKGNQ